MTAISAEMQSKVFISANNLIPKPDFKLAGECEKPLFKAGDAIGKRCGQFAV